jgi:RND family efflux transporter MFP subunit
MNHPQRTVFLLAISASTLLLFPVGARSETITTPGITAPILDSTLGTPVPGIVAARNFKEGDTVKKGDVVLELDRSLEDLEVARREVVLEPLKADYEASKFLFDQPKSSISKEQLDKKQADYKVALAEFQLAKEQARKRSIFAPFDGTISEFFLQVGEACQLQQPLLRIVDTTRCYFVCNVESKAGHGLRPGQKVDLEIEAGPAVVLLPGTISFVSPVVDPASGLLKVKAIFENAEGKVRPGVAGKMTFDDSAHVSARR